MSTEASLRGAVTSLATRGAVPGATVQFIDGVNAGKSAVTDAMGRFQLDVLSPGAASVKVTAPDGGLVLNGCSTGRSCGAVMRSAWRAVSAVDSIAPQRIPSVARCRRFGSTDRKAQGALRARHCREPSQPINDLLPLLAVLGIRHEATFVQRL